MNHCLEQNLESNYSQSELFPTEYDTNTKKDLYISLWKDQSWGGGIHDVDIYIYRI